jgi:hypothetical protein
MTLTVPPEGIASDFTLRNKRIFVANHRNVVRSGRLRSISVESTTVTDIVLRMESQVGRRECQIMSKLMQFSQTSWRSQRKYPLRSAQGTIIVKPFVSRELVILTTAPPIPCVKNQYLSAIRQFAVLLLMVRHSRTKLRTGPDAAARCVIGSPEIASASASFGPEMMIFDLPTMISEMKART